MANDIPTPAELTIQTLTRLDCDNQKSLPHYFAQLKLSEKLQIEDMKKATIIKFRPSQNSTATNLFFMACWLYAINEFRNKKKKKLSAKERDEIEALRLKHMDTMKKKQKAPKRKFIIDHLPLIKKLLGEGKGWRQISQYLKTYHKKNVSFNYLRTVYVEVQAQ